MATSYDPVLEIGLGSMGHLPGSTGQGWEKESSEDVQKTNRFVGFFKFFFFSLISKFLLILVKRKNTHTPPTCPPLQLLQAFKRQKVERCLMSWLGGSSESTPPGHAPGGAWGDRRHVIDLGKAGAKFGDVLLP